PDLRILEILVRIDRRKLHRHRGELRQDDLELTIAEEGLDLEARLVDDAAPRQAPAREHVAVIRVEGAVDIESRESGGGLQRPEMLPVAGKSQHEAIMALDQFGRLLRLAAPFQIAGR